jgi:hypothetical protein
MNTQIYANIKHIFHASYTFISWNSYTARGCTESRSMLGSQTSLWNFVSSSGLFRRKQKLFRKAFWQRHLRKMSRRISFRKIDKKIKKAPIRVNRRRTLNKIDLNNLIHSKSQQKREQKRGRSFDRASTTRIILMSKERTIKPFLQNNLTPTKAQRNL